MKHALLVSIALILTACQATSTPPLPTPVPVSPPPDVTSAPDTTAVLPSPEPNTALPPTETPTVSPPNAPDATSFPNPDNYTWETIVTGLARPVDLKHAGDERLFIIEKVGRIRIVQNGDLLDSPFLNIVDRVGSGGNEQGLLGLAFHPNYVENGLFFVNYTDRDGNTVISRFQVTPDPNVADPTSETVLLRANQPYRNHNGGSMAFGPDGYLYLGLGDGGSAGDPQGNGQRLDTFLGKILRINVNLGEPYAIPADNPYGTEVWAYGLRNPWRISFDTATGDLYIGDVGQNNWEEIDFVAAGTPGGINFGWNILEGTHPYAGGQQEGLVMPIAEYDHGQGCSVTGGYVYRGSMPEWNGVYLYGDYCSGTVWGLIHTDGGWQNQVLFGAGGSITSFGQDNAGEVYLVLDGGQILRLSSK